MINKLLFTLLTTFSFSSYATSYATPKLSDLVKKADHILIAIITKVDMIDGSGKEVKDLEARTGPGGKNRIRFHLEVKTAEFIKTNILKKPKEIVVELDHYQHLTLGDMKPEENKKFIFMLKGKNYKSVYPYFFRRSLNEKKQIIELSKKLKK